MHKMRIETSDLNNITIDNPKKIVLIDIQPDKRVTATMDIDNKSIHGLKMIKRLESKK